MSARTTHGAREPRSAPPSASTPAPPGTSMPQPDPAGRLAYSVSEAARITGLSRDLLYDEMRRGNLAYLKVGRRRLITLRHLEQFLEITPGTGPLTGSGDSPRRTGSGAP
jgi:excisionase family DNA binding protein